MKRYLPFVIVAGVALAALGSGAMLYRAKRALLRPIPESKAIAGTTGAESPHIRGNPNAPVIGHGRIIPNLRGCKKLKRDIQKTTI